MTTVSIGSAAASLGVTTHTLRYYEQAGLIRPVARSASGHRRYTPDDLDRLAFLHCLRSVEMPIRRIREYAELAHGGRSTAEARIDLLRDYQAECRARAQALHGAVNAIDRKMERLSNALTTPHARTDDRHDARLDP